ncbi:MAG TPA: SGNH/GDSL hydrolase family protein [Longimicrobium sp.]|nr:SGNH/GDSL hydrolase family protein [Longimicrobium sp.]
MRGLRAAALRGIRICLAVSAAGGQGCAARNTNEGGRVGGSVRYLALGDSFTIGEGVDPAERWPVQLAAMLRARGVDVGDPEIVATTGWTTDELAAGIDAARPQGPYALVSLLIGVNNQYRGLPVDAYRPEFRALLQRAIAFAGGDAGRVIVVSIPDWGVTAFAEGRDRGQIAREIESFNAVNRDAARELGAHWVDVTPTSRRMPDAVAGDGLHPSGAQYRAWAGLVLPEALAALGR